jgi:dipeptidyl aminopeptidase/acylaminoacyl peptidase
MEALIGENPPDDLRNYYSSERQVNGRTPVAFLWHTANDAGVPVENSIVYATALSQHQIPFDLHIYADGPHGVGLAEGDAQLKTWTDLCALWFKKIGFLTS